MYIAILSVDGIYVNIVSIDEDFNVTSGILTKTRNELVTIVRTNNLKPVNFSIDRDNNIREDAGSFKRFQKSGVGIVIAEIKSPYGRSLGYKIIQSTTGTVVNMRTEEIVQKEKVLGRPFLQNGIVRNDTVNCYPLHSFPVIKLQKAVKPSKVTTTTESKVTKPKSEFTEAQKKEIQMCRSKGINSSFIEDVRLTPEQMRVCWVAKTKGVLSEYFAKPEYSVEVMKFYADRLVSNLAVKECKLMLQHPNLKVSQLSELYLCICEGVDYSEVINDTASDIRVYRQSNSLFTENYNESVSFDKALSVARKLKGWD